MTVDVHRESEFYAQQSQLLTLRKRGEVEPIERGQETRLQRRVALAGNGDGTVDELLHVVLGQHALMPQIGVLMLQGDAGGVESAGSLGYGGQGGHD